MTYRYNLNAFDRTRKVNMKSDSGKRLVTDSASHPKRFQSPHHSSINEEKPSLEILHCLRTHEKHENWPGPIPAAL